MRAMPSPTSMTRPTSCRSTSGSYPASWRLMISLISPALIIPYPLAIRSRSRASWPSRLPSITRLPISATKPPSSPLSTTSSITTCLPPSAAPSREASSARSCSFSGTAVRTRTRARGHAALWRRSARRAAISPTDPRDGVINDAAVLLVAQALAHQLLGHGDGDVGDLTPQLLARAANVRLRLRPRGLDEQLRLATCGLHQLTLLLRGFLERRRPNRLRFRVGRADSLGALLLLPGGLGARGLRRLQRGLDGHGALLHLREERFVEKAVEDGEKDEEVEHLDDQRLVEADQPAAAVFAALGRRERQRGQQHHARGHDGGEPYGTTLEHWADSPGLVVPQKVCENYHPAPALVNPTARSRPRR